MRRIAFLSAAAAAFAVGGAALALPVSAQAADVTVTLSPQMERKARDLGRDEVMRQAGELERRVERALAARPDLAGARVELVLNDLVPNRPTFQQLGDRPGLSHFYSFGIGGADIQGAVISADGESRAVNYRWYSPDIRDARHRATWQDADRAFMNFASRLANDRL